MNSPCDLLYQCLIQSERMMNDSGRAASVTTLTVAIGAYPRKLGVRIRRKKSAEGRGVPRQPEPAALGTI
jgi:hypothetical protein